MCERIRTFRITDTPSSTATPSELDAADFEVSNWAAALAAMAQYASTGERTLIILDEFQYLAAQQRELGTLLNNWWRMTGRTLPLVFIIAGSEGSFSRKEALGRRMYGRRSGQLPLVPFDYSAAALFVPGYSDEDKVRTYAVCGGMPYYLDRFVDSRPLAENILRNVLYRDGFLHEEVDLLLRQELPDPRRYFSVLDAIARGATRNSEIANRTGLDSAQTYQALDMLERLELVERLRPASASPSSKKTAYAIRDGFLNFYFRFVEPYKSRMRTRADAERHLTQAVLPNASLLTLTARSSQPPAASGPTLTSATGKRLCSTKSSHTSPVPKPSRATTSSPAPVSPSSCRSSPHLTPTVTSWSPHEPSTSSRVTVSARSRSAFRVTVSSSAWHINRSRC